VAKLVGEYYCRVYADVYGLSTACLRYFNVFGPRQNPHSQYAAVIPAFITALPSSPPKPANETGEDIAQYAGLWRRAPILAAIMLVFLLSLAGVPLTIGFGTKIKLFSVLFDVGNPLGWIGIAAIATNTVIAAFAYFRVIRQMYLADTEAPRLIEIAPVSVVALVFVVPNLVLFVAYGLVNDQAQRHAEILAPARPVAEHVAVRP
jgi:NADH:ubiquinone oxidoreductase subunit 2 (subunit N)